VSFLPVAVLTENSVSLDVRAGACSAGCPLEVSDKMLNAMKKGSSSEITFEREYLLRSSQAKGANAGGFEAT